MKRLTIIMAILIMIVSVASAMPVVSNGISGDDDVSSGVSLIFGGQGDYNTLGTGKANWSLMVGYSQSMTPNNPLGRWYVIGFGELGRFQYSDEYKIETRAMYFLHEPRRGFNFVVLFGPGIEFEQYANYDDPSYTITRLLMSVGFETNYSFTEFFGTWAAFEFEGGEDYVVYRFGLGVNITFKY